MSTSFTELGVPEDLVRALHARGIDSAFPIQAATLADALNGQDVCGRAPTGSGKTLAFGIPVVTRVGRAQSRRPRALVLAPTRELAAQICEELTILGSLRDCRVASFYGGVGFGPQLDALRRGVDIAVACPGRLADLIDRGAIRLNEVEIVVVDEADRMADMGFMPVVRELLDQVNPERQTLLFSATLDGDVKELIRRYQKNPKRYEVDAPEDAIGESATHHFWRTDPSERVALATRIVRVHRSAMVFCRTKRGVDRLVRHLKTSGLEVGAIHGDRSQAQRDQALDAFRSQRLQVLVGTDVAARGIHVDGVDCVVHFDPPEDEKAYVHRSGRTGRAGAGGTVVSLVTREHQSYMRKLQSRLELGTTIGDPDEQMLSAEPIFVKNMSKPHGGTTRPSRARDDRPRRQDSGRPSRPRNARQRRPVSRDVEPRKDGERVARDGRGREDRGDTRVSTDGRSAARIRQSRPSAARGGWSGRASAPASGSGASGRQSAEISGERMQPGSGRPTSTGARRSPARTFSGPRSNGARRAGR